MAQRPVARAVHVPPYKLITLPLAPLGSPSKRYRQYLRGKRVAVVGPAGYLEGQGRGREFDGYDAVVRMNRSRPMSADYGRRTDVLYNFVTELWADHFCDTKRYLDDRISWVVSTRTMAEHLPRFRAALPRRVDFLDVGQSFYKRVWTEVGSKPNTGTVAIAHLLEQPIRSLDVFGVDLFASGHHRGYKSGGPGAHDFDAQALYLALLAQQDKRLVIDRALKERIRALCRMTDTEPRAELPPISVLIPYRPDNGWRDRLFAWTGERYRTAFPELEVCVGECDDEPFNRARAINTAAARATRDLYLIADIDALFTRQAVEDAAEGLGAYARIDGKSSMLDRRSTERILAGGPSLEGREISFTRRWSTNFFCLVTREAFEAVGGFDEAFRDWGGEDFAFYRALEIYHGRPALIRTHILHLWHPENTANKPVHMRALKRKRRGVTATADRHLDYAEAKTREDIERLRASRP